MIKAVKLLWIFAGVILLCAILYTFIDIQIMKGQADSAKTLFFAAGLYTFIIYLVTTGIFILAQEIIKRVKEV